MPYISREDGERFVVPSYRDVLTAKRNDLLKKEIMLLSQSYGEYITLQRKDADQYEVTLSPESGFLLGESIWQYFKQPTDLVYCELLPNGTEAILVIVIAGSVYLDGSFPVDNVAEELVIFKTQKNNFEIHISPNVPIAETPEGNKFVFDATSVKSFSVLQKPIFPTLPLYKQFQLQPVERALAAQGIGVTPIKPILLGLLVIGLGVLLFTFMNTKKEATVTTANKGERPVNPYLGYNQALTSKDPAAEISELYRALNQLITLPGWEPVSIEYSSGTMTVTVKSKGSKLENLYAWAKQANATVQITQNAIFVSLQVHARMRSQPTQIYPTQQILSELIDRIGAVMPGNNFQLGNFESKGPYKVIPVTIKFNNISPDIMELLGKQFKDLPLVVKKVMLKVKNGSLTGTINLDALGN